MSSLGRPDAAVRMMMPPLKPSFSRKSRTMARRRERSSRESIFLETPTWSTVGMNTRNRPASEAWDVRRAPFVPSGSLTTCTTISWPSCSSCSMRGSSRGSCGLAPRRPLPPSPPLAPSPPLPSLPSSASSPSSTSSRFASTFEADVHERRLHAGQHFRHPALVDVADDAALAFALDEQLRDEVVLENGDAGLVIVRGDDHLLGHSALKSLVASRVGRPEGLRYRRGASIRESPHADVQDQPEPRK